MHYALSFLLSLVYISFMNVAIAAGSEGQGITIPLFPRLRTDAPSTHIYRSNISVANSHE